MNIETLKVLLRHLLGGGPGLVSDDELTQLASGLMVAISIGWSIYDKRRRREEAEKEAPPPPPSRPVSKYGKRDR